MKNLVLTIAFMLFGFGLKAQGNYTINKDPKNGTDMIVGEVTESDLSKLSSWETNEYSFSKEYDSYIPDSTSIKYLKEQNNALPYIFVVLGTWCGDSKEHLPHFLKVIDLVGYPKEKIFMVAVDRDKKGGNFCLADFNIELVPTFILTSKGEEIGRIIESPESTIEQDLVKILSAKVSN